MAFPTVTNISGSNPGPNSAVVPDTVQSSIGNLQKVGTFQLTAITPSALASGPSIAAQQFAATGIGVQVGDIVHVTYQGAQTANVGIADARVYQADGLEIKFFCTTGTPTPAAASAANPYLVDVYRVQPNWTKPASGSQMDW
jgi:hypothetical protein